MVVFVHGERFPGSIHSKGPVVHGGTGPETGLSFWTEFRSLTREGAMSCPSLVDEVVSLRDLLGSKACLTLRNPSPCSLPGQSKLDLSCRNTDRRAGGPVARLHAKHRPVPSGGWVS